MHPLQPLYLTTISLAFPPGCSEQAAKYVFYKVFCDHFQFFVSSINVSEERQTFDEGQNVSPGGETIDQQAQVNEKRERVRVAVGRQKIPQQSQAS